ncbi:hypothetical protein GO495_04885 [Chitinophaga oryziterrae]|uniref:Uncharacterized protein n=1 Tax=Chitinophaga oryziterrae TaxID=1031224 RepID=A0A6N8J3X3_9BACT|nr:hypothetical protein [Chitinophaga oryziterrae]MVT39907.1 hypothetical protein [Chitinophaga oryziterrae]
MKYEIYKEIRNSDDICIMKQKIIKYKSDLFKQEVTLTVDESLNKLKGRVLAPKKLEAANKTLRRLKHALPK